MVFLALSSQGKKKRLGEVGNKRRTGDYLSLRNNNNLP
jgi:hypothetical protein